MKKGIRFLVFILVSILVFNTLTVPVLAAVSDEGDVYINEASVDNETVLADGPETVTEVGINIEEVDRVDSEEEFKIINEETLLSALAEGLSSGEPFVLPIAVNNIQLSKAINLTKSADITFTVDEEPVEAITGDVVISSYSSYYHFEIGASNLHVNMEFDGVILNGGSRGGGIYSSSTRTGTELTLKGGTIQNTYSSSYQGAVRVEGANSKLTLEDMTIQGTNSNKSSADGGAVRFVSNNGVLTVNDSRFLNNTLLSGGRGAGIYCEGTNAVATVTDSEFTGNSTGNGAAFYLYGTGASATITGTKMNNNTALATGSGGALSYTSRGGAVTLTDCEFIGNNAGYNGGAIWGYYKNLEITDCDIKNNTTRYSGGGIYVDADNSVVIGGNTVIEGNASNGTGAGHHGGGIFFNATVTYVIKDNVKVINNTAANNGGGISHFGKVLIQGDVEISGNTAANNGGAVYCVSDTGTLMLKDNVKVTGNTADNGGGVYNSNLANVQVRGNVVFSDNKSAQGYRMTDAADIALHNANIDSTVTWANGFDYAYNNHDIYYIKGEIPVNYKDAANAAIAALAGYQKVGTWMPVSLIGDIQALIDAAKNAVEAYVEAGYSIGDLENYGYIAGAEALVAALKNVRIEIYSMPDRTHVQGATSLNGGDISFIDETGYSSRISMSHSYVTRSGYDLNVLGVQTVTVSYNSTYFGPLTTTYEIEVKKAQAAPVGVEAHAPTMKGGMASITGVDETMEYSTSSVGGTWYTCTASPMAIAVGSYSVRYKETNEYAPGEQVRVHTGSYVNKVPTIKEGMRSISGTAYKASADGTIAAQGFTICVYDLYEDYENENMTISYYMASEGNSNNWTRTTSRTITTNDTFTFTPRATAAEGERYVFTIRAQDTNTSGYATEFVTVTLVVGKTPVNYIGAAKDALEALAGYQKVTSDLKVNMIGDIQALIDAAKVAVEAYVQANYSIDDLENYGYIAGAEAVVAALGNVRIVIETMPIRTHAQGAASLDSAGPPYGDIRYYNATGGSSRISIGHSYVSRSGYDLNALGVQTVTVTYRSEYGDLTTTYEIEVKKLRAAPVGVEAHAPTVKGGMASITGVDETMEYSTSSVGGTWYTCTASPMAIAVGSYSIRYKETDEYAPGEQVRVHTGSYVNKIPTIKEGMGSIGATTYKASADGTITAQGFKMCVYDLYEDYENENMTILYYMASEGNSSNWTMTWSRTNNTNDTLTLTPKAAAAVGERLVFTVRAQDTNTSGYSTQFVTVTLVVGETPIGYIDAARAKLKALIDEVDKMDADDYTKPTWEAVQDELIKAKSVLEKSNATAAELEAAYDALKGAVDKLEIFVDVTSVKIEGAAIQQVRIRNTKQFAATVNPIDATYPALKWESSNDKIFTVDGNGLVTGVGTGSAKLIVTATNGKTSFIMVQVTA